jgi:hypothetical protein
MRPLSRRAFLTTGGAAALTFVTLKTAGMVSSARTVSSAASDTVLRDGPLARLGSTAAPFTHAAFQPHVGTPFRVQVGASAVDLQLTSLKQLAQHTSRGASLTGQQFSLAFNGPAQAFGQETYAVEHGALGHFTLFLVPVGKPSTGKDGQTYEAVINNATI